jgi:hypothetical protein
MPPLLLLLAGTEVDMATRTVTMALVTARMVVTAVATAVAMVAALTMVTVAATTKRWQKQRWQRAQTTIKKKWQWKKQWSWRRQQHQ